MNFVLDERLYQDQLVKAVSEMNSVEHFAGTSLDPDGALIDANGLNLPHCNCILHVS